MATIMKYKALYGENRLPARWRDNDKQKSKTFDRQKLAKDFMVKIENDMREGSYVSPSKIRVSEYLTQWIDEHQANLAPSTAQRYRELIVRENAKIGSNHLQRLNPSEIPSVNSLLRRTPATTWTPQGKQSFKHRLCHRMKCRNI